MLRAIRIVRLPNLLIAAFAILFGRYLAGGGALDPSTFLSIVAVLLLVAGFYVINDISDREIDRVNRPDRPIASGELSIGSARLLAALFLALSLGMAIAAGGGTLIWLFVWGAALTAYEARIKRRGLLANLLVSIVTSSVLLYGAWLGDNVLAGVVPTLFAFFLHLGREVLKDICDMPGDRKFSRATLPITRGKRGALAVSISALALLVLLTPIPYFIGLYNLVYLVIVLLGVDLVLVLAMTRCARRPDERTLARFSRLLKGEMWVGMAAMLLGSARGV